MKLNKKKILKGLEKHRINWSSVAKKYGWYKEPFFVQVWINKDSEVVDSVSFNGLKKDLIVDYETETILKLTERGNK